MSDDTVQQVYMRVTQRIQSSQKQLSNIDAQVNANQREARLASLTKREIEGLSDSVPLYRSMGKMFVQESKQSVMDDINKTTKDSEMLVDALEKKKKFVKRELDEATANLKDIIKATTQQQAASAK
ncbi:hypothetical protein GGF46_004557 [Coemansia sp. RSA 552]|nr:hypothetical protein GGF46_004557 [Coemansia sp. RSA 552]